MQQIESRKITSGTREWAEKNINIVFGCENNCQYCYAKKMAIRFGRKTNDNWKIMEPNFKVINTNFQKSEKTIMFPSSHDITPNNLHYCIKVLENLLKVGNEILIVTKPWPYCIDKIINLLFCYKNQIEFRFTITSSSAKRIAFWETHAPSISDRLNSLLIAHSRGFNTSVSIEPFLDSDPTTIILKVAPHVSHTIWLGKMNYFKTNGLTEDEKVFYDYQRRISSWSNIQKIIEKINWLPRDIRKKIRYKDTIINMCKKNGLEV